MIIANMATFPPRRNILVDTIERILPQVDRINLCLNEYEDIPIELKKYKKLNAFIPDDDYKDVGKFIGKFDDEDYVLLIDDDIIYPKDYIEILKNEYLKYSHLDAIVGLHGVIYADLQDRNQKLRKVFNFTSSLYGPRVVNQLGTGTVFLKGYQMPDLNYMKGSQQYVDVRFARYLYENKISLVCIPRQKEWLRELNGGESIWQGFTQKWPMNVTKEVQKIAGYSKLNFNVVQEIEL